MGSNGAHEITMVHEAEDSGTTIEIKIKTLDSQTYSLRVNKEVPVPDLKEQIASVTGVLSEQQRLICRGKVLKDDQLLSAYHVEDGHTLHLVSRQPVPPSSENLPSHPATDTASSTSRTQRIQIAPGIVVETVNMPEHADGFHPDVNRIVTAVLGSFGIHNYGQGSEGGDVHEHGLERRQSAIGAGGMTSSTQRVPEEAGMRRQLDRSHGPFGFQTSVASGHLQPSVIPDSLTTLAQYLRRMRQEYSDANGRNNAQAGAAQGTGGESNSPPLPRTVQERLPTPSSLAEVLFSTGEMLIEQAAVDLLQLGRRLLNQSNMTDPMVRLSTQSYASRSGILFQNLGAFLLELGRATMTLRMGQTPSEAVVNAGPAVFISQSGPNPLMVQPLPFQPGTSFGSIPTSIGATGSGLVRDVGAGFLPRHVEIHIRRGSSTARANVNQEEHAASQQHSGQRGPAMNPGGENHPSQATSGVPVDASHTAEPGVRLGSLRTMVAAVPGPPSHLPVLGRFHHVASGRLSRRGSQAFGEYRPNGFQTEIQSGFGLQHNIERHARDADSSNSGGGQGPLPVPTSRNLNINVFSTDGSGNNQESESELPSEVLQFLSTLFPGSEIHVGDAVPLETVTASLAQSDGTTSAATDLRQEESRESDEGIFLSNLLQQIMPFISQLASGEPNLVSSEAQNVSEQRTEHDSSTNAENSDVGTSRQQSDVEPSPPNSKRQKLE